MTVPSHGDGLVCAAGVVPWRPDDAHGVVVLLIHRPRYDDWTFPKGKCEEGEGDEACACRELDEEAGLHGVLGRELSTAEYVDHRGRPKQVRYWEMLVEDGGGFTPNDEVDEVRWLPLAEAAGLLSYPRDVQLVVELAALARD